MIFVRQDFCYVAIAKDKRSLVLIALTEIAIKTLSKIELQILRVDFFQFLDKSHESRSWILEIVWDKFQTFTKLNAYIN